MSMQRLVKPDWKAWRDLLPGKVDADRAERLSGDLSKTTVYRAPLEGREGPGVIAKLCPPEVGDRERTVYERVLPQLPLTAPRYYGAVEAGERWCWILMEEIQGEKFSPLIEEHRLLAARWLGLLHSRAAALTPAPRFPDRGPAHYRDCLEGGRRRIRESLGNPALAAGDGELLESVAGLCDSVDAEWPRVEAFCSTLPVTLIHGDFRPKNARVRSGAGGPALLPMDWETAGWGVPAPDLAPARGSPMIPLADLTTYGAIVRQRWPALDGDRIGKVTRLGAVFRRLAAISWASENLGSPWPEKAVSCLRVYRSELEQALVEPLWSW